MTRIIEQFFDYFSRVTGIMMEQRILGAVVILALFAILAILVDFFIHRIANFIGKRSNVEIDNTLIGSIHRPAWIILLLIGALMSVTWLNLDQPFNFIVEAILKTLLILAGAVGLGRLMKGNRPQRKKMYLICRHTSYGCVYLDERHWILTEKRVYSPWPICKFITHN